MLKTSDFKMFCKVLKFKTAEGIAFSMRVDLDMNIKANNEYSKVQLSNENNAIISNTLFMQYSI